MADEEVIALLTEIRDIQKVHLQNYKDALKNQEIALKNQQITIETQAKAVRFQRRSLAISLAIGLLIAAFGIAAAFHPSIFNR